MNTRIRNLFGFNNNNTKSQSLRGQAYEDAVACDPPVRGSYPVAGNGPNVLEQMQIARAKREQREQRTLRNDKRDHNTHQNPRDQVALRELRDQDRSPTKAQLYQPQLYEPALLTIGPLPQAPPQIPPLFVARVPSVSQKRGRRLARPTTAPAPADDEQDHFPKNEGDSSAPGSRSQSVFSIRSLPSSLFGADKRDSVRSRHGTTALPPLPASPGIPPGHAAFLYNSSAVSTPRSSRRSSQHVDLLDAYSEITQSNAVIKQKARASGLRNYGEDVADRNINTYGEKRDHQERPGSGRASQTRQTRPTPRATVQEGENDGASSLTSQLAQDQNANHGASARINGNTHTPQNASLGSQPMFPIRVSSMQHFSRSSQDTVSFPTMGAAEGDECPSLPPSMPQDIRPTRNRRLSADAHSRLASPSNEHDHLTSVSKRDRAGTGPDQVSKDAPSASSTGPGEESSSRGRRRRSGSKQDRDSITGERTRRHRASVSYSAFPNVSGAPRSRHPSTSSIALQSNPLGHAAPSHHATSRPSTAQSHTDATSTFTSPSPTRSTKKTPDVLYEDITSNVDDSQDETLPTLNGAHDSRQNRALESDSASTEQFKSTVPVRDHEIPDVDVHDRPASSGTIPDAQPTHLIDQTTPPSLKSILRPQSGHSTLLEDDESAESPTIPLVRSDPPQFQSRRRSLTWSIASPTRPRSPIKISTPLQSVFNSTRKGSLTRDSSALRNEYVFHDPLRSNGRAEPGTARRRGEEVRVEEWSSDDDRHHGRVKTQEEELLFRDSGYGSGGMLPGLLEKAPMAKEAAGLGLDLRGDASGDEEARFETAEHRNEVKATSARRRAMSVNQVRFKDERQ